MKLAKKNMFNQYGPLWHVNLSSRKPVTLALGSSNNLPCGECSCIRLLLQLSRSQRNRRYEYKLHYKTKCIHIYIIYLLELICLLNLPRRKVWFYWMYQWCCVKLSLKNNKTDIFKKVHLSVLQNYIIT